MLFYSVVLLTYAGLAVAQTVTYDIATQPNCTEVERSPSEDCRWVAGLDMADHVIEGGRIAAYRIRYSDGKWSEWYVPGTNDLSDTYNDYAMPCSLSYRVNSMRRRWAMFYDHYHRFIICKPQKSKKIR